MTPAATPEALEQARALVRHSLKVGAPGLSETAREAVLRSIMLKLEGKVLAPLLADLQQVTAELDEARADQKEAEDSNDALNVKLHTLAPHGSCACSYDNPGDVCLHHSPALATATAEAASLRDKVEALKGALTEIAVGETEVFDEGLGCNISAWLSDDEMQDIARTALARAATAGEGRSDG